MRIMRHLIAPTVVAVIWALRRLYQQKPVDWNTCQRVTRYLRRRTAVDIDEPIAANKATYRPGMEAHATNAPYRRSGVSH